MQSLNVEENGSPAVLPRFSQEDDRCKNKRPGEADSCACDSEEAQVRSKIYQCCCGASGNICCADNCYVPDLVCCGNENSELCIESSVRLDPSGGGPKSLDDAEKVLYPKNHGNICRAGCSTDQISCANNSYAGGSIVETGPAVSDLSAPNESEDDWELAADALSGLGSSLTKITGKSPEPPSEEKELMELKSIVPGVTKLQNGVLKPEYKFKAAGYGFKSRGTGGRAWRPDDVSRPPTLPPLSKQLSFQQEKGPSVWSGTQLISNPGGPPPVPSFCPICTEELDTTDTSFFPCSCGFRLCLFCHHRISSDDGRCPGCRKIYSPDVAIKLSRTSFWLSV